MTLHYGPHLHHLRTVADLAATVAEPSDLPEFAFTPKAKHVGLEGSYLMCDCAHCAPLNAEANRLARRRNNLRAGPETFTVVDVSSDRCTYPKLEREPGEPRQVSHKEALWLRLQTTFEPKTDGLLTPYGRSEPFHKMVFPNKHVELSWLAETQRQELATMHEEMRANGFASSSLSSTPDDEDDLEAANYSERSLGYVPYALDPETLAPLLKQIDWERYLEACGTSLRIFAKVKPDGLRTISAEYVSPKRVGEPAITNELLADHLATMRELVADRSNDELLADRERAYHYGKLVLSLMSPDDQLRWTRRDPVADASVHAYINFADDNTSRVLFTDPEPVRDGGPQELGFHDGDAADPRSPLEPSEFDLWPMTDDEFANGLAEDPGYATWS